MQLEMGHGLGTDWWGMKNTQSQGDGPVHPSVAGGFDFKSGGKTIAMDFSVGAPGAAQLEHCASADDICGDLLPESVETRKFLLRTKEAAKRDLQIFAVDFLVEVEEVNLDQSLSAGVFEGGTDADIGNTFLRSHFGDAPAGSFLLPHK